MRIIWVFCVHFVIFLFLPLYTIRYFSFKIILKIMTIFTCHDMQSCNLLLNMLYGDHIALHFARWEISTYRDLGGNFRESKNNYMVHNHKWITYAYCWGKIYPLEFDIGLTQVKWSLQTPIIRKAVTKIIWL